MVVKPIKLSPKRGGNGYISSYSVNLSTKEAKACGFLGEDGAPVPISKKIDDCYGRIIIQAVGTEYVGRTDFLYLATLLRIVFEHGDFPKNIYALTANTVGSSIGAVYKGISRITKALWYNTDDIIHRMGEKFPGPLNTLYELAYFLSSGKII